MKDFDRLIVRFRQFGGLRLVWEYAKLGVLWVAVREFFKCIIKRKSFKAIYPKILEKVEPMLVGKYLSTKSTEEHRSNIEPHQTILNNIEQDSVCAPRIWWCWLQGLDNAPELAKVCLKSLEKLNTEIVVVDDKNYTEWVVLPEYVVSKYKAGKIPAALFSDILRLALLVKHGGAWIDSTVLYTGVQNGSKVQNSSRLQEKTNLNNIEREALNNVERKPYCPSWKEITEAELFLFQYAKPGSGWNGSVGNWFIAAKAGNELLKDVYASLCAYWKENDVTLDYYICHLFIAEHAKRYPEMISKMPYGYAAACLQLRNNLGEKFTEEKWEKICSLSNFHKMGFRLKGNVIEDDGNYYNHIIKKYKETYTRII